MRIFCRLLISIRAVFVQRSNYAIASQIASQTKSRLRMAVLEFFLPDTQPKKGHLIMPSQQSHLRSVTPHGRRRLREHQPSAGAAAAGEGDPHRSHKDRPTV